MTEFFWWRCCLWVHRLRSWKKSGTHLPTTYVE